MRNSQQIRDMEKTYTLTQPLKNLLDKESQIIKESISAHPEHKDPRKDNELIGGLIIQTTDPNVYYRLFIQDYRQVLWSQLDLDQVRISQIDKEDCKGRIGKSITTNGLNYPPFIDEKVVPEDNSPEKIKYRIGTGHNRSWTVGVHFNKPIPCFVRTRQYKITIDEKTGRLTIEEKMSVFYGNLAKIRANRPASSRQYTMDDVKLHLDDLRKTDPTFGGLIDGIVLPNRDEFDGIMDLVYGSDGYFCTAGPRTKIWKRFTRGSSTSKHIDLTSPSEMDSYLSRQNYHIGRENNSKRQRTGEHLCCKNDAIVLLTDSNGRHLEEKISLLLEKEKIDESWSLPENKNGNPYTIHAFARIYKPSSDRAELTKARDVFVARCKKMNLFLESCGSALYISKLIFPQQLVNSSDHDITHNLKQEVPVPLHIIKS